MYWDGKGFKSITVK